MARVKLPLEMANGVMARTIEDLRGNFDIKKVVGHFFDGKLKNWLEVRYYEEELEKVNELSELDPELAKKLCEIFGVEDTGEEIDVEVIQKENERLLKLKQYTDDEEIIANIDSVAFNQEELADLYDRGVDTIYLCSGTFIIPENKNDLKYELIGQPIVEDLKITNKTLPYNPDDIHIGDSLFFGESNTRKLKWVVLDISESEIFVILHTDSIKDAYKNISTMKFDSNGVTEWKNSSLRKLLNQQFIGVSFNELEKVCIVEKYNSDVECMDKIFLLSLEEVYKYKDIILNYGGKTGHAFWSRTSCSQILPNIRLFHHSMSEIITPDMKEELIFKWFNNVKECIHYFSNDWIEDCSGQPMFWRVMNTRSPECYAETRPVMILKK